MNDDLIYKQDVQKLVCRLNGCVGTKRNFDNCEKRCPDFKAVDELATVKQSEEKGFWIEEWGGFVCSKCKFLVHDPYYPGEPVACPNCGADMRGDSNG